MNLRTPAGSGDFEDGVCLRLANERIVRVACGGFWIRRSDSLPGTEMARKRQACPLVRQRWQRLSFIGGMDQERPKGLSPAYLLRTKKISQPSHVMLRRCWKTFKTLAGLHPSLKPHKLRHIYATKFREAGVDFRSVRELLGQAQPGHDPGIYECHDGSVKGGVKPYEPVHPRA